MIFLLFLIEGIFLLFHIETICSISSESHRDGSDEGSLNRPMFYAKIKLKLSQIIIKYSLLSRALVRRTEFIICFGVELLKPTLKLKMKMLLGADWFWSTLLAYSLSFN